MGYPYRKNECKLTRLAGSHLADKSWEMGFRLSASKIGKCDVPFLTGIEICHGVLAYGYLQTQKKHQLGKYGADIGMVPRSSWMSISVLDMKCKLIMDTNIDFCRNGEYSSILCIKGIQAFV